MIIDSSAFEEHQLTIGSGSRPDCRYDDDLLEPPKFAGFSQKPIKYFSYNIDFHDGTSVSGITTSKGIPVYYVPERTILRIIFKCKEIDTQLPIQNFTYFLYQINEYKCLRLERCPPPTLTPTFTPTYTPTITPTDTLTITNTPTNSETYTPTNYELSRPTQPIYYPIKPPLVADPVGLPVNVHKLATNSNNSNKDLLYLLFLLLLIPFSLVLSCISLFLGFAAYRRSHRSQRT